MNLSLEIRTHPSHNKGVNPAQFVRSKSAHPVESKGDSVRSSFNSFAINIGLIRSASADLGAGRLQVADFASLLSPGALAGGLSHGHIAATAERCPLFHQSSVPNASLGFTA